MLMRTIVVLFGGFLLLARPGEAQGFIRYYPTFTGGTITAPLLLPDGSAAAPSLAFTSNADFGWYLSGESIFLASGGTARMRFNAGYHLQLTSVGELNWSAGLDPATTADLALVRDAANTLAQRNGTNAQKLRVYNSFTTLDTNYGAFIIDSTAIGTDLIGTGAGATATTGGLRSIQGSRSKAITDAVATAFVRLSVADDDYEGCGIVYTAYAEDTATDARQSRTGRTYVAILNNSGTEAAVFSTGDSAVAVTAGTFTCAFTGASAVADTIDLSANCNTSLAATTTLMFEYRLDCPSTVTVTPQ